MESYKEVDCIIEKFISGEFGCVEGEEMRIRR